ncbi:hypothetical protein ANO11243_001330 [Dothideomycetidae sp. 11243]|nr:hypothetical protein ANO11243_001330 [fungal sp. No.11243]
MAHAVPSSAIDENESLTTQDSKAESCPTDEGIGCGRIGRTVWRSQEMGYHCAETCSLAEGGAKHWMDRYWIGQFGSDSELILGVQRDRLSDLSIVTESEVTWSLDFEHFAHRIVDSRLLR